MWILFDTTCFGHFSHHQEIHCFTKRVQIGEKRKWHYHYE